MLPHFPEKLPLANLDWSRIGPLVGQAGFHLGQYSGALDALEIPDIYFYSMTTQEAIYSSRIEGTNSTFEEVAGFGMLDDIPEARRDDLQEVINYQRAMTYAVKRMKELPLSLRLIKEMHAILLDSVRGKDKGRGEFRRVQNWIGGRTMETAAYMPPPPERVMEHLDNWEKYLHIDEPEPLVQMAIIHAQFESIHPFVDGNGRVGRMLIPLFLYQRGLLSRPVFSISPYIDAQRQQYYDGLNATRQPGGWESWIAYFLAAVREQARENTERVKRIAGLYTDVQRHMRRVSRSIYLEKALAVLFAQPILTTADFVDGLGAPRQSAVDLLQAFKNEHIVKMVQEGAGRRPETLAFSRLLEIMR
jgi:Fic family protein